MAATPLTDDHPTHTTPGRDSRSMLSFFVVLVMLS